MTKTEKTFEQIKSETLVYKSRHLAFAVTDHCVKAMRVMLGDDGKYWVTTPANCSRLEKMGYEFA